MIYETRCNDFQSQFNQLQAERKKLVEKNQDLEKEIDRLKALLDDAQKQQEKTLMLQELRDQNETQMHAIQEEIKLQYENRIENTAQHLQKYKYCVEELIEFQAKTKVHIQLLQDTIDESLSRV